MRGNGQDLPPHLRAKVTATNVIAADLVQQCIASKLRPQNHFSESKGGRSCFG